MEGLWNKERTSLDNDEDHRFHTKRPLIWKAFVSRIGKAAGTILKEWTIKVVYVPGDCNYLSLLSDGVWSKPYNDRFFINVWGVSTMKNSNRKQQKNAYHTD